MLALTDYWKLIQYLNENYWLYTFLTLLSQKNYKKHFRKKLVIPGMTMHENQQSAYTSICKKVHNNWLASWGPWWHIYIIFFHTHKIFISFSFIYKMQIIGSWHPQQYTLFFYFAPSSSISHGKSKLNRQEITSFFAWKKEVPPSIPINYLG